MEALVEYARFLVSEEVGMARAELMQAERTLPLRVVVLRERGDDGADAPGRVLREAVRLPEDDLLRTGLRGYDWAAQASACAAPATHRDADPCAGLTAEEAEWARAVTDEWSETSGRQVQWSATVYEDHVVELRLGSRSALVGTRGNRVLGWVERPTAAKYARMAASVLGTAAVAGGWATVRLGVGLPTVVFGVGTALLLGVVSVIARPRLHAVPPPTAAVRARPGRPAIGG